MKEKIYRKAREFKSGDTIGGWYIHKVVLMQGAYLYLNVGEYPLVATETTQAHTDGDPVKMIVVMSEALVDDWWNWNGTREFNDNE